MTTKSAKQEEILLVHGTFAAKKDCRGEDWWQAGSEFSEKLANRLTKCNVRVSAPFQWSGSNTQTERTAAAVGLLTRLLDYEKQELPYHLIGHSHGGSVIWEALQLATFQKRELRSLKSWATVGTPFFGFGLRKTTGFLFAIFLSLAFSGLVVVGVGLGLIFLILTMNVMEAVTERLPENLGTLVPDSSLRMVAWVVAILAGGIFFAWNFRRARRQFHLLTKSSERAMVAYLRRWLGLYSSQDEALNGLSRTLEITDAKKRQGEQPVPAEDPGEPQRQWGLIVVAPLCVVFVYLALMEWGLLTVLGMMAAVLLLLLALAVAILVPWIMARSATVNLAWDTLARKLQGNTSDFLQINRITAGPCAREAIAYPALPDDVDEQLVHDANENLRQLKLDDERLPELRAMLAQATLGGTSLSAALIELGRRVPITFLVHCLYFHGCQPILELLARHIEQSAEGFQAAGPSVGDDALDSWMAGFRQSVDCAVEATGK